MELTVTQTLTCVRLKSYFNCGRGHEKRLQLRMKHISINWFQWILLNCMTSKKKQKKKNYINKHLNTSIECEIWVSRDFAIITMMKDMITWEKKRQKN